MTQESKGLQAYKAKMKSFGHSAEKIEQIIDARFEAYRQPTKGELKFGEGALHYKTMPLELWLKDDGSYKLWTVCPVDGLRYYRSKY